jgi:hypothetical protein
MAKKRKSTSRAHRVAVGIGRALGSLQARLDKLNSQRTDVATDIKAVIRRAQSMLAAIGPNTSGDRAAKRKSSRKKAKKTGRARKTVAKPMKTKPVPAQKKR